MRDTTQLHPTLQKKITQLITKCEAQGITIGISECLRTAAEQDVLYAQGRTKPGAIVTNAKGSNYSSMHQWGIAFDFYLKMDVDGDGKTSDDAYNNSTKLFNKVGAIGQSLGLEWGGAWTSIVDLPHFQLPDWGSTANKLKATYGTPERFMMTWTKDSAVITAAQSYSAKYAKSYTTKKACNLKAAPGRGVIAPLAAGTKVNCYGYYTERDGKVYLYVQNGKKTGFIYKKLLQGA